MKRPNIVYVVADQWRGDCLGLYKNRHPVMTPHLNQLACEGTLFTQAYADCPICMPQRVTMLTGKSGSQLRCLSNFRVASRPTFDLSETLPARLSREAGYQTKAIGKMHFAPARSRYGFEHVTLHPDDYICWLEDNGYGGAFRGHGLGGNDVYPAVATVPDKYYHTTWIVDQAVRFLDQRDPDVPFFLFLVFEAPHSPFDPPAPYDRMYDNFQVQDPVMGDWVNDSDYPVCFDVLRTRCKLDHLTPEMIRETRRRYYGQISHIDYNLGLLFGALRLRGLDNNSLIVFTADHGECLGDHGLFHKHCFLQAAAHVPLILRLPISGSDVPRATERHAPVLTADICPTLIESVGLTVPGETDGRSIIPLVRDEKALDGRLVFGETPESACVIDGEHKYIFYRKGGHEQLFDIRRDPDDRHNLSGEPGTTDTVAGLRQQLVDYLQSNGSDFVLDGDLAALDATFRSSDVRSRNPAACRGPMRWGMGY